MKTLTITFFLLMCFALTSYSQDTITTKEKKKPKATYQIGFVKVTVWENKTKDGNIRKDYQIEKIYKKNDKWFATNIFNESELLELKAAIDKTIAEESVKVKK